MLKKGLVGFLFVLFVTNFFQSNVVIATTNETQAIFYYVDIATLNTQEKSEIVKGNPNFTAKNESENIRLIYQKNDQRVLTPNDIGSHNYSSTKIFPQTGESKSFMWIIGILLSTVLIILLLLKRKVLKKMGIVLIFIVSILFNGVLIVHAESNLSPSVQKKFTKGSEISNEPEEIDGFTYLGYLRNSSNELVEQAKDVVIRYIDESGNSIHLNQIISGTIGDEFDVTTPNLQLTIEGYILDRTNLPANMTGIFTNELQTVVYTYSKNAVIAAPVTISYQDSEGHSIHPDQVISGNIGDKFDVTTSEYQLEIEGFTLNQARLPENRVGILSNKPISVLFIYEKDTREATIRIKFVDNNGAPFMLPDLTTYLDGGFVPFYPDIDKYTFELNYNRIIYDQYTQPDISIPTVIGETYTLPKKMKFTINDAAGTWIPYIMKFNEDGSGEGLEGYWNYDMEIPDNYTGIVIENEVVVTYVINCYGVAFPEP
ncbi:cell surface protein [Carnobacterium maltaromaticum]|uniref:MucBP domain-containing protein n=1 Tax=Carnobacterium maltaromaticum TaxID=2751 RepID=UPI000C773EE4|nr:MucBP domain-containing protein [Carnobacterium maltaromaticum]PLS37115.1 cell surface protein [Carnobacterium maltaromaticum]PLS37929.1 cell surface protein [Carnobacterium maltaromaticum]PLS39870.1 cell surface protein [Carnobacterium maltaromaticum]PLS44626.1 cell surface protein [Carnobacterium maltaromaticum]PLS46659.1 cell surface protein [Carnobacterium maltaromaticum]